MPDTSVRLRVRASEHEDLIFDVRCDGCSSGFVVGTVAITIRSLAPGPHRLYIDGGEGRDSVIVEFTIEIGVPRDITIMMPPLNARR